MRISHIIILVTIILTLIVGYQLMPHTGEQVTMLMRDKKYAAAYAQLQELFRRGDRNPNRLVQLVRLHERYGYVEKVEEVLRAFMKEYPGNVELRTELAAFYMRAGQKDQWLKTMEELVDRGGRRAHLEQLLARHGLDGNGRELRRLLAKYQERDFFTAGSAARLALFHLRDGKHQKAIAAFRKMDDLDRSEQEKTKHKQRVSENESRADKAHVERFHSDRLWPMRIHLYTLLLDGGHYLEATSRAGAWIAQSGKGGRSRDRIRRDNVGLLMEKLQQKGLVGLTTKLGSEIMRKDPSAVFEVIGFFDRPAQQSLARSFLAQWRATVKDPPPGEINQYVKSCIGINDLPAAMAVLAERGFGGVPQQSLIALGEEMMYQDQDAFLKTIRPFLTLETLRTRPLFAAALFHREGRFDLAKQFLGQIDPVLMKSERLGHWLDLSKRLLGPKKAFAILQRLKGRRRLSRVILRRYADLAQETGHKREYAQVWASLGGRFPTH